MNIKILLYFILFIKCYSSLELILFIDFTSNQTYSNNECGGSIDVIEINGIFYQNNNNNNNNNTIYPPCRSTSDAGIRARQFISNTSSNPYRNTSLIIYFQNFDWRGLDIVNVSGFGIISSFCFFDIRVYNEPNAIINFNGENTVNPIFQYQIFAHGDDLCDDITKPRIQLKNIRFKNFLNTKCLIIINTNINIEKPSPTIELSSITTINSNIFIELGSSVQVKTPLIVKIKDCTFSDSINLKTQKGRFILNWYNKVTIDNCIFNNFINNDPIITSNYESTFIENSRFTNVKMSPNVAIINLYGGIIKYNNLTIDNCQLYSFLVFFTKINGNYIHQLNNIIFKNNNILFSTTKPTISYSFGFITFLGNYYITGNGNGIDTNDVFFNNITFEPNNIIFTTKVLLYVVNMTSIHFSNFNISSPSQNFQTIIVTDITPIKVLVDNSSISLFTNSLEFCESDYNSSITIQLNKQQKQLPKLSESYLKEPCKLCNINYILLEDFENNNSSSQGGNNSSNNNNNSSSTELSESHNNNSSSSGDEFNNIESDNKDNGASFKTILLIPIVIVPFVVILGAVISISFFIKKKKIFKKEKGSDEGENGVGDFEKNINVVGEIVLQELAVSD
ncbi:hypothetical protein ACTFIU_007175 [Dictyostelium citrinum]